jgi:NADH-quinone oxidoreductase subunit C
VIASEVLTALGERLPGIACIGPDSAPSATVEPAALRGHLLYLRDQMRFDFLVFVSALDRPAQSALEIVYRLFSYDTKLSLVLRVKVPRDGAHVASASDIYRTAEWHERETAELFGITFDGHPDPRRLLLPDDLEGFPLRKDFTHPNMIRLPEVE